MLNNKYENNNDNETTVLVVKFLRKLKHYTALSLKGLVKLLVFVVYDRTLLKYFDQKNKLNKILANSFSYNPTAQSVKTISIALILRDGKTHPTSSAFIRLISPLSRLQSYGELYFKIYKHNTAKINKNHDICIVQRTAYDNKFLAKKLVLNLKKQSTKLIVDNDDAFTLINKNHSEYHIQSSRALALDYLIKNADQVWVSTQNLAHLYHKLNKNVRVVVNSLDQALWKNDEVKRKQEFNNSPLKLVYMGTATHDDDFKMIYASLAKLHKNYPNNFMLSIIGVSSKALPEDNWIERLYQPSGHAIYPRFVKWFQQQGPFDIGLCPLVESDFNNYKSDIKCLDYFGIGASPFVSKVSAYSTPGLKDYITMVRNSDKDWYEALEIAVSNPGLFREDTTKKINKASNYLWAQRSIKQSSQYILKLIEELLSK